MQRSQQPCHRAGEEMIQYLSKPELFGHRAAFSYWPLALAQNLKSFCNWQSDAARERGIRVVRCFARDGHYGQEQACKESEETRGRNTKDNIRSYRLQNEAQQELQHPSGA